MNTEKKQQTNKKKKRRAKEPFNSCAIKTITILLNIHEKSII